jgi:hypothetical protein
MGEVVHWCGKLIGLPTDHLFSRSLFGIDDTEFLGLAELGNSLINLGMALVGELLESVRDQG